MNYQMLVTPLNSGSFLPTYQSPLTVQPLWNILPSNEGASFSTPNLSLLKEGVAEAKNRLPSRHPIQNSFIPSNSISQRKTKLVKVKLLITKQSAPVPQEEDFEFAVPSP